MKIISWNLRNIATNKLRKTFSPRYSTYGLGGSGLDYITRLVTGDPAWSNINSATPVDIFAVVELKTGGKKPGNRANGSAPEVLQRLVNAMNTLLAQRVAVRDNYNYAFVPPLVTGFRETVGIIYNTKALTLKDTVVLSNLISDQNLAPRGPLAAEFTVVSNPAITIAMTGIHAPPTKGTAPGTRYRNPINYNQMLVLTGLESNSKCLLVGDFNCNPASSFVNGNGGLVYPFTKLPTYQTTIPNGTPTSLKKKLDKSQAGSAQYLSSAYDNILYNFPVAAGSAQNVLDMVGFARDMNTAGNPLVFQSRPYSALNQYQVISDHLPLSMEFNFG